MKILAKLLIPSLLLLLLGCSNKTLIKGTVEHNKNAKYKDGVISVVSWVTVDDMNKANSLAMENALQKVLFEGIPNSSVKRPLFKKDRNDPKYKRYFNKLFENPEDYVKVHSYEAANRIKTKVGYKMGISCSIYYKNLRKKLERDKIIKEFGL